jgi:putative MATE family efflux protein
MFGIDRRMRSIWRRTIALGWPIAVDQTLATLMRTVDVVVTGLFSPVAVAAVGLADLYAQLPLRIGLGLGAGTIALSSQDTGRGAAVTRDQAITQALLLGAALGVPFVLLGLLVSRPLIAILGADTAVVRQSGRYLGIVLAAAPMQIVLIVGSRALQGTGDTTTPMYINAGTNALNIVLTVVLGLGIRVVPTLGIVGVGIATAISRTLGATVITATIAGPRTEASLARPRNLTVTRQLVRVSVPNFAEGLSTSLANFPLNALILLFGTEANAAYHIGSRIFRQLTGPFYRSVYTVASIIVGQSLGEGDPDQARFAATAILLFSVGVLSVVGASMFAGAEQVVRVFTRDPTTIGYAVDFTRAFAVSMVFVGVFYPLAGTLVGAGDTRTPFYARFVGVVAFLLCGSYLLGVSLGLGLFGVYVGIVLSFVSWALIVVAGFRWGGWQELAVQMIADRSDT